MSSRKITELNEQEAKLFLREEKNYVNFSLPHYFHFSDLLTISWGAIFGKNFKEDVCKKGTNGKPIFPSNYDQVNYTVLGNKDGSFDWRAYQLIHPVLYVDLVNLLTTEQNWKLLVKRFGEFNESCVECISLPRVSQGTGSHKASQVSHWWEEIEQRSLKLALKYDYLFVTDISNCYPSIYTHSIEWALAEGGREEVKKNRTEQKQGTGPGARLGKEIDQKIQNMNAGQTNGIPQGSTLMDFIAEIVLGYADTIFCEVIKKEMPEADFHILRYRDDYKIFVNDPVSGQEILKHLNSVLFDLNLKMNPQKTSVSDDVVMGSIKGPKLERIFISPNEQHYQKEALRIYQLSKKYPNAGLIAKELSIFHDRIAGRKYLKNTNIEVLISIFTSIAVKSPSLVNWISAILSNLLLLIKNEERRIELIRMIHEKFKRLPNTSLIDVWLQRISAPLEIEISYEDKLTQLGLGRIKNTDIWESSWLNEGIVHQLNAITVSNLPKMVEDKALPTVISRDEVELFKINYD